MWSNLAHAVREPSPLGKPCTQQVVFLKRMAVWRRRKEHPVDSCWKENRPFLAQLCPGEVEVAECLQTRARPAFAFIPWA